MNFLKIMRIHNTFSSKMSTCDINVLIVHFYRRKFMFRIIKSYIFTLLQNKNVIYI